MICDIQLPTLYRDFDPIKVSQRKLIQFTWYDFFTHTVSCLLSSTQFLSDLKSRVPFNENYCARGKLCRSIPWQLVTMTWSEPAGKTQSSVPLACLPSRHTHLPPYIFSQPCFERISTTEERNTIRVTRPPAFIFALTESFVLFQYEKFIINKFFCSFQKCRYHGCHMA